MKDAMSPSGLAYSPSRRFSARPKWNPGHSFNCAFSWSRRNEIDLRVRRAYVRGQEGAEFVNWMHQVDARERDVATHGDLDQLRADIAELRQEMQVGFATLETRFERRVGDLIKWSFVFWVGAVGAIAMLARA